MSSLAAKDYAGALERLAAHGTAASAAAREREMAYVCGAWADFLNRSRKAKVSDLLAVVERGLRHDPSNEVLLTDLAGLLINGGDASEGVRKALKAMLADDRLAAPALYAMGMEAWVRGRHSDARRNWEEAFRDNPEIPVLTNNLASCLIATDPPDPTTALTMIDRAISQRQVDPRLRVTRGQVLGKLGRWKESAAELERAQAEGQNGADLHQALSEAYAHLLRKPPAEAGDGKDKGKDKNP
jgi:tetratricopeptide (TPR) repeat protein